MTESFRLVNPERKSSCAVFSSPHSGSAYPAAFLSDTILDKRTIRSSEDAFVDRLFDAAPRFGAPLLSAVFPRAFVDLNRNEDELDPALILGAARRSVNPRVAAGLGVIPRVVAEGKPIRAGKLPLHEAVERLRTGYHPYHTQLRQLMIDQRDRHGIAVLFDCHSMPHDALSAVPAKEQRPHVILGDRFGASAARWIVDAASDCFVAAGFSVARNAPFAGGHITQHYGRPARALHAVQIEIDRSLYMNEKTIEPLDRFEEIKARLDRVVAELCAITPLRLNCAAE